MREFTVYLSAVANVEASVKVMAQNAKEATELAEKRAEGGDVVWEYNGVDDSTIVVNETSDGEKFIPAEIEG